MNKKKKNPLIILLFITVFSSNNIFALTYFNEKESPYRLDISEVYIGDAKTTRSSLNNLVELWYYPSNLHFIANSYIGIATITIKDDFNHIIYKEEIDTETQRTLYIYIGSLNSKSYSLNIYTNTGYNAYAYID